MSAPAWQMALFDPAQFPEDPELEAFIERRERPAPGSTEAYTGALTLRELRGNAELAEAICTALVRGMSLKEVARRFQKSPRTIRRIKQAMEDRGELAPIRQRIVRLFREIEELTAEEVWEGVLTGKIHPGQGWIPMVATWDKSEQAESGVVAGTGRTVPEIDRDSLLAELEAFAVRRAVSDSVSGGQVAISAPIEPTGTLATGAATGDPAALPVLEAVPVPVHAAATPEGGGGGLRAPGGQNDRWEGPTKF